MKGLWACSYAVGSFERSVLIRRAGLDGFTPGSPGAVARQLGVSVKRIRRAQRVGVRNLRAANRSDGCAMGSPSHDVGQTVGTLRAVATAPALVTDGDPAAADAPALPDSELADQGDVLGDQASSTDVQLKRPQLAGTLSAAAGSEDGSAPWLLLLILALIALAAAAPLLLHRRRQANPAPAQHQPPPQVIPTPAAELWVEPEAEPWPEQEPEAEPEPEPQPEPESASESEPQDPPPQYNLPPAPWTEGEPEAGQEAAPTSPEPKSDGRNGGRRRSGITFSLMAYLAVTLMMRTRRRR